MGLLALLMIVHLIFVKLIRASWLIGGHKQFARKVVIPSIDIMKAYTYNFILEMFCILVFGHGVNGYLLTAIR